MADSSDENSSSANIFVATQPIDFSGEISSLDEQARVQALAAAQGVDRQQFPVLAQSRYSHTRVFDSTRYSIRSYVPEDEGSGYWDLFRLSADMLVFVGDCMYHRPKWLGVPDQGYLKIRLLRSGMLLAPEGNTLLGSPGGMLAMYPHDESAGDSYFIAANTQCRIIILHCASSMISTELGIDLHAAPLPLRLLACNDFRLPYRQHLDLTPRLVNAVADILDSRDMYTAHLRDWFVEAKAKEILTSVIQSLVQAPELAVAANRITRRDQYRILEAQAIMKANLSDLPTIPALSRMVGINQTKLKAGFKAIVGSTIGDFVKQQQMECAVRMLHHTELAISEISDAVGYRHPANFSQAFKRFYGYLPKKIRSRGE